MPDERSPPDSTELSFVRQQFAAAARLTHQVEPARLATGDYGNPNDRYFGEGDIYASYSGDVIAQEGRVRQPFRFQGRLMVTVGLWGRRDALEAEAYSLIPIEAYGGASVTYHDQMNDPTSAESARHDPAGAYNGIRVSITASE